MSKFHTGGHISDGKDLQLISIPPRGKNLVFTDEKPEIYENWMKHLETIGVKDDVTGKYKIGEISEDLTTKLFNSLKSIPKIEFDKFDCNPDYVASQMKTVEVPLWQRFLPYFDFQEEQLALVKLICEELKPIIEEHLGTGFRVINVKAFETKPGAHHFGPNKIHTDSRYPTHTYKVFLYFTKTDLALGTTKIYPGTKEKINYPDGPIGTYLLFNPVCMQHHGVPPQKDPRAMMELIIVPAHETEISPTFNGTNSTHPISP